MTSWPIGVGVLGANSETGWAAETHLPALQALPDFRIAAVATTRMESAEVSARRYDAKAFVDPDALINDPDVDLVTVSVNSVDHYGLVEKAIAAGKHVLCEWPLSTDTRSAAVLAEQARAAGNRSVIGMQAVSHPALRYVRDLIADNHIGSVESINIQSVSQSRWSGTSATGAPTRPQRKLYLFDPASGAGPMKIQTGHLLSGVVTMLGNIKSISATTHIRHPKIMVEETGEEIVSRVPDQIALTGIVGDGTVLVAEVITAHPNQPHSHVDITGSKGTLRLESIPGVRGGYPGGDLRLLASLGDQHEREQIDIPASYRRVPEGLTGVPGYVGELYAMLANDIRSDTHEAPDFDFALRMHHVIDAVEAASEGTISV